MRKYLISLLLFLPLCASAQQEDDYAFFMALDSLRYKGYQMPEDYEGTHCCDFAGKATESVEA